MNLTQREFDEGILAIKEEIAGQPPEARGIWKFRSFKGGVRIERPDDWVQRIGADGHPAMVKESKPPIHFVENAFRTSNIETVLFLRTHRPKFGGIGKQYIETTSLVEAEAPPIKKTKGPQLIKKWGRSKADALVALGQRDVPLEDLTSDMSAVTFFGVAKRALEYGFVLEGRSVQETTPKKKASSEKDSEKDN